MTFELFPYKLKLVHEFGISRSRRTEVPVLFLKMEESGIIAWGECSPNPRYNETVESCSAAISKELSSLSSFSMDAFRKVVRNLSVPGLFAAATAVDLAMWDFVGKQQNVNLRQLWNLPHKNTVQNTYTIGLDNENILKQKLEEARSFPLLKVKLGTENDADLIDFICQHSTQKILVDANEGWKTVDQALSRIQMLQSYPVIAVEQPMPKESDDAMPEVKVKSELPLFADESISLPFSMEKVGQGFHGINIKLMKTGGISEAFQQYWKAKSVGMQVMIGCMIESSLANMAASIFASVCDFSDVDSFNLISNNPVSGLEWNDLAVACENDSAGFGIKVDEERLILG